MTQGSTPPAASDSSVPLDQSQSANQYTPEQQQAIHACLDRYWKANVWIMRLLLLIWASAGLGAGILFADKLNEFQIAGFQVGFWFAQQGSIIIFVLLILVYCITMNHLDTKHHQELQALRKEQD